MLLSCVLRNRRIYVREALPMHDEPKAIVRYYATRFTAHDLENWTGAEPDDVADVQVMDGCDCSPFGYSIRFPRCSFWSPVPLLGTSKPDFMETEDIPKPRVRRGVEVQYRNGRWEKYLKTKGWVAA